MQVKKIKQRAQLINLHPKELALILALREKFPYGDVVIAMKHGIPIRIKQAWIFDDLDLSTDTGLHTDEI